MAIDVKALGEKMVAATADFVKRAIASRITPLESRIKALEDRPQMRYLGVWREGQEHTPGAFVTHDGSLWHCNAAATSSKPGTCADWQLAVKRGRDAPGARARTPE